MRLKSILVLLAICGGSAGFAAVRWHSAGHSLTSGKSLSVGSTSSSTGPLSATALRVEGSRLEYDVDFESKLGASQQTGVTLTGNMHWTLTPAPASAQGQRFWGETSAVSVVFDQEGQDGTLLAQTMSQELKEPFGLELAPDGQVSRIGISPRGTIGPNLLKDLAGSLQFVHPPGGKPAEWSAREEDHLGGFRAKYQRLPNGDVRKVKEYTAPALPSLFTVSEQQKPRIDASAVFAFEMAGTSLPSHVEVLEQLQTATFKSDTKATFALTAARNAAPASASALDGLRWLKLKDLIETVGDAGYDVGRKHRLVDGKNFESILSDLTRFPSGKGAKIEARHLALRQLTALFDLDPRAIADAKRALSSGAAGANAPALLGSLSDSTAPEARDALADLGKDVTLPSGLREDAVANLSLKAAPTPSTFDDLRGLTKSEDAAVRGSAVLALGTSARNAQADAEPQAVKAREELTNGVKTATTSEDKVTYLTGAGNAGGQTAVDSATASLEDPRPEVREAAVMALRFAPAPMADQLLSRIWSKDPVGSVRVAVSAAAGFRPLSPVLLTAAFSVLKADTDIKVRLSVIRYLNAFREDSPVISQALEDTAKNDPEPDVRTAAAQVLGQISTPNSH